MTPEEYEEAVNALRAHGNRFFRVSFWRENDKIDPVTHHVTAAAGSERHMICRFGVRRGLKGTADRAHLLEISRRNGLVTVYEMPNPERGIRGGWKSIKLSNIFDISTPTVGPDIPASKSPEVPLDDPS